MCTWQYTYVTYEVLWFLTGAAELPQGQLHEVEGPTH